MKILVSWLRDFVDVPGTPEEIAQTMSVRGFAVESIEPAGESDAILDFEITANRPDCMSVIGMAREVATAYGLPLRQPAIGGHQDRAGGASTTAPALHLMALEAVTRDSGMAAVADIDVTIDAADLCPRYVGAVADVSVGASPAWMQARLTAAGVRPISNIVDITNYVLLELGQPMHAFDRAKVSGAQIVVRRARDGERLKTLDGQTRALTMDMLVIADAGAAMAIAGVMGGADSEVTAATTAIVFESACFNPLSVRRTSRALGLKTEASMRFERGSDPLLPVTAMQRACALLEITEAGRARGTLVDACPAPVEPAVLRLRRDRIRGLLGASIPDVTVRRLLESLGFVLRDIADGWDVTIPTRRVDAVREVDLIEEIARHYGFDNLPVTFPALTAPAPAVDPRIVQARRLRTLLTGAGFSEAVTFGFIAAPAAARFGDESTLVPIANPLSETFAVLRPSVLPGLIDAVAHNRRREQRDVRLFEVGAHFSKGGGERRAIACAWTGAAGGEHWSGGRREVDFFDVKGIGELIGQSLQLDLQTVAARTPFLMPGRSASLTAGGTSVGVVGQLLPAIAEAHGLPAADAVYVVEIELDAAESLAPQGAARQATRVEPLPRFPSVTRDISILIGDMVAAADVRRTIRKAAPDTLARVREFDRYQGKGVPDGKVSLSLRLTFRSPDRTLTDGEVQGAMDAVLTAVREQHDAVQR